MMFTVLANDFKFHLIETNYKGMNLTTVTKNIYTENYKSLLREILKEPNKY